MMKIPRKGVYVDKDTSLTANSDDRVASQKATKTYVDALLSLLDALVYKGVINCVGNPNYPAANCGWAYKVSVAGKIGGALGINVMVGDLVICLVDGSLSGDQATVGANWTIIQSNIDFATDAETIAGTLAVVSVTPASLKAKLGTQTDGGLLVGAGQTGAVEALPVGLTTEILVGGGAATNPVWTTATGSGAPVRATSPVLVTPTLGVATETSATIQGTTGGFTRKFSEATVSISAAATCTIEVNIPATSKIIGCQLRADTALTAGELWDAAYSGGSTDAICTGQAVAQNTKVNSFTSAIVTSETDIAITKTGGGNFTAAGVIRAIVYYEMFETMASL